jgi:hypothetical protein
MRTICGSKSWGDGLHVVTVDRSEELLQRVDFGVHALALGDGCCAA